MKRFLMAVAVAGLVGCGGGEDAPAGPSTLQSEDITVGTGATAVTGDTVTVHYVLSLTNGQVLQRSRDFGQPFTFRLGTGGVIAGWDQGVPGMRVGGKRKLTIPASLAYGNNPPPGSGIPQNATLVFEIELISIAGK